LVIAELSQVRAIAIEERVVSVCLSHAELAQHELWISGQQNCVRELEQW
jgi:hypothetical protein